jgi:hypothetical protein
MNTNNNNNNNAQSSQKKNSIQQFPKYVSKEFTFVHVGQLATTSTTTTDYRHIEPVYEECKQCGGDLLKTTTTNSQTQNCEEKIDIPFNKMGEESENEDKTNYSSHYYCPNCSYENNFGVYDINNNLTTTSNFSTMNDGNDDLVLIKVRNEDNNPINKNDQKDATSSKNEKNNIQNNTSTTLHTPPQGILSDQYISFVDDFDETDDGSSSDGKKAKSGQNDKPNNNQTTQQNYQHFDENKHLIGLTSGIRQSTTTSTTTHQLLPLRMHIEFLSSGNKDTAGNNGGAIISSLTFE